jgi:hypothetical protein
VCVIDCDPGATVTLYTYNEKVEEVRLRKKERKKEKETIGNAKAYSICNLSRKAKDGNIWKTPVEMERRVELSK